MASFTTDSVIVYMQKQELSYIKRWEGIHIKL
jgi:hypothetical protein